MKKIIIILLLVIGLIGCTNKTNQGQNNKKDNDDLDKGLIVGFAIKLYNSPLDATDEINFETPDLHYFFER